MKFGQKWKTFLKLLEENPVGIDREQIQVVCELKSISNIYALNKTLKNKGYNIKHSKGTYKLMGKTAVTDVSKNKSSLTDDILKVHGRRHKMDPALVARLTLMNQSDQEDALDMLKKSYFYQQSAAAVIEASEMTSAVRKAIQ